MANAHLIAIFSLIFLTFISGKPGNILKDDTTDEPEDGDEDYRLPDNLEVFEYKVNLTFPKDLFTAKGNNFSGISTIIFQLKTKVTTLKLHASKQHLDITEIRLNNIAQRNTWEWNPVTDILSLSSVRGYLVNKNITLEIHYTGVLNSGYSGVYKSNYVNSNNEIKYLLSTQMEPVHARTVFPCFDEPYLKAEFYFNITIPSNMKILFNTPLNLSDPIDSENSWYTFDRTPRMSTYLVAFVISDLNCTKGADLDENVPYQVCSRNDLEKIRAFAVEYGPKSVGVLESMTGIKYSSNIKKLDQIALNNFSAGAMENWGLITYREGTLLYDEDVKPNQKQAIAAVISHELAHQWFGNLVTCKWWSETFLNEGFARYLEYFATHQIYKEWQLDKQFITSGPMHAALTYDSLLSIEALQSDVSTPAEIEVKFGTISYDKGASILHMVFNIMGADSSLAGVREYLNNRKGSYAEPSDLWSALENHIDNKTSNIPEKAKFTDIIENWTKNPGYPLLTVSLKDATVKISQERFLMSGEDKISKWYVPISYATSSSKTKSAETNPSLWLTPDNDLSFTIDNDATWIILNNNVSAYYRVNYEESLWSQISSALNKTDFDGIGDLNRAQIVDDAFNLFKIGKLNYSQVFMITEFLKNDLSLYSWQSAINSLNYVNKRISNSELRKKYQGHILNLMNNLYKSAPLNQTKTDDHIYTSTQVLAGTWACYLGHQDCIDNANQIFESFKQGTKMSKEQKILRGIVYCNAIRYSTNSSNWEVLWQAYKNESLTSEHSHILSALGCTSDVDLQKKYLQMTISADSGIRAQDGLSVFSSVYTGSAEGVNTALEFFIENYVALSNKYGGITTMNSLIKGLADRLNTEAQINQLKQFVQSNTEGLTDGSKQAIISAVETATVNVEWMKKIEDEIYSYYEVDKPNFAVSHEPMVILILSGIFTYLLMVIM